MEKDRLSYLLNLRNKNLLTPAQSQELEEWVNLLDLKEVTLEDWVKEKGGEAGFVKYLQTNFEYAHYNIKVRKIKLWKKISIAASISIIASVGFYYYKSKEAEQTKIETLAKIEAQILPGTSKATLILSDGAKVDLGTSDKMEFIEQSANTIAKTQSGKLDYQTKNNSLNDNSSNTVIVPNGGDYQIVLSDGTAVWLNAASKLTFPVKFTSKERRVKLSGEAYFEVAHNKNSPFLVETNNQTVKVLGTHFNINAYNDENYTKTTLIEGSVKVQSATNLKPATLLPGEQATLGNNTLVKNTVDTKEVLAWKNKMFRIYDQDLYSIMKQIGRWYNVDVEYRGNLSDLRFGLYISKKRNIEQVLELMEVTKTVKFKIEGRKVIVIK